MEWSELKEEAKKMGYVYNLGSLMNNGFSFDIDGFIWFRGDCISTDRTPDQMFAIMKALQ